MKYFIFIIALFYVIYGCNSTKTTINNNKPVQTNAIVNDTIRIANDELEYEIIIIEPGFEAWLVTQPPMGHYGINYLENRNRRFVLTFNDRVFNNRSSILYEQKINYETNTHYGLEVNYLLYNYFLYFQKTYKQKL